MDQPDLGVFSRRWKNGKSRLLVSIHVELLGTSGRAIVDGRVLMAAPLTAMMNDTTGDIQRDPAALQEVFCRGSSLRFGSSPDSDYARRPQARLIAFQNSAEKALAAIMATDGFWWHRRHRDCWPDVVNFFPYLNIQ